MKARPTHDPMLGPVVLDEAYSLGCLAQLGEFESPAAAMRAFGDLCSRNRRGRGAIYDQFRMGQRHETLRGQGVSE